MFLNKSFQYIDSIAKGRVWVGKDAKEIGLIDEFGGLYKSIEIAAKEAKIKDYGVIGQTVFQSTVLQLPKDDRLASKSRICCESKTD